MGRGQGLVVDPRLEKGQAQAFNVAEILMTSRAQACGCEFGDGKPATWPGEELNEGKEDFSWQQVGASWLSASLWGDWELNEEFHGKGEEQVSTQILVENNALVVGSAEVFKRRTLDP